MEILLSNLFYLWNFEANNIQLIYIKSVVLKNLFFYLAQKNIGNKKERGDSVADLMTRVFFSCTVLHLNQNEYFASVNLYKTYNNERMFYYSHNYLFHVHAQVNPLLFYFGWKWCQQKVTESCPAVNCKMFNCLLFLSCFFFAF